MRTCTQRNNESQCGAQKVVRGRAFSSNYASMLMGNACMRGEVEIIFCRHRTGTPKIFHLYICVIALEAKYEPLTLETNIALA